MLRAACVLASAVLGCGHHDVDLETPRVGRALTSEERAALQDVADAAFRDARPRLQGLPARLTLIVRWGKDVIPETGETGTAGYPNNIALTLDPDRDILSVIYTHVRACLVHELHHLARRSATPNPTTLRDRLVSEGLATAFERDVVGFDPPWGRAPDDPDGWTRKLLDLGPDADAKPWFDGSTDAPMRWMGTRVGTYVADRAMHASGKSAAALALTPTDEVLRLAAVR